MSYRQLPDCTCDQCKREDELLKDLFNKKSDVKQPNTQTPPQKPSLFSNSSSIFGTPSSTSPDTFGTPNTSVFGSSAFGSTIFGSSNFGSAVKSEPTKQTAQFSFAANSDSSLKDLLSKPSVLNTSKSIFGTNTPKTDDAASLFGIKTTTNLFGTSTTTSDSIKSFSFKLGQEEPKPEAKQTESNLFKSSSSSSFNTSIFNSPSSNQSTNIFGSGSSPKTTVLITTTTPNPNIFVTSNTPSTIFGSKDSSSFTSKDSSSLFGSKDTSSSTNLFSKGATFVFGTQSKSNDSNSDTQSEPAKISTTSFESLAAGLPSFGSLSSQDSTSSATSKETPLFGSLASKEKAPLLGTAKDDAPSFGSLSSKINAPSFGSLTKDAPSFGSLSKDVPSFGSLNKDAASFGSLATKENVTTVGSLASKEVASFGSVAANKGSSTGLSAFGQDPILKCDGDLSFASLAANTTSEALPTFATPSEGKF